MKSRMGNCTCIKYSLLFDFLSAKFINKGTRIGITTCPLKFVKLSRQLSARLRHILRNKKLFKLGQMATKSLCLTREALSTMSKSAYLIVRGSEVRWWWGWGGGGRCWGVGEITIT